MLCNIIVAVVLLVLAVGGHMVFSLLVLIAGSTKKCSNSSIPMSLHAGGDEIAMAVARRCALLVVYL